MKYKSFIFINKANNIKHWTEWKDYKMFYDEKNGYYNVFDIYGNRIFYIHKTILESAYRMFLRDKGRFYKNDLLMIIILYENLEDYKKRPLKQKQSKYGAKYFNFNYFLK